MNCDLYVAGHRVHPIHWRKFTEEGDSVPAEVLDVDLDEHRVTFAVEGEQRQAWHHDVARMQAEVADTDAVVFSPRWRILRVGRWLAFLALERARWEPCRTAKEGPADPAGRVLEFGGFLGRVDPDGAIV